MDKPKFTKKINELKIAEELNEFVKEIDDHFTVDVNGEDLNLKIKICNSNLCICYFSNFEMNSLVILQSLEDKASIAAKTGIIHKFYTKAIELMDKYDKYTVSLSEDSTTNYLNIDKTTGGFFFSTNDDTDKVQAYFTKTEIENMKNDPRFEAINFDKAVIEEVNC